MGSVLLTETFPSLSIFIMSASGLTPLCPDSG